MSQIIGYGQVKQAVLATNVCCCKSLHSVKTERTPETKEVRVMGRMKNGFSLSFGAVKGRAVSLIATLALIARFGANIYAPSS